MKKRFGQNFLKPGKVPPLFLSYLPKPENTTLVEIGPGDGALTAAFLGAGYKVVSIEVDYDMIPKLIKRFDERYGDTLKLINESILDVNLEELVKEHELENIYFVGNLPFNISKRIVQRIKRFTVSHLEKVLGMLFILQYEVTKDYTSKVPTSSKLGALTELWAKAKKYESISSNQFTPKPHVNAGILELTPKEDIPSNLELAERLIKVGFSSPRKKLSKNVSAGFKIEKSIIEETLEELNYKKTARPAEITSEGWIKLADQLERHL